MEEITTDKWRNESILKSWCDEGKIFIETANGGVYSQPLEVFPELFQASPSEREDFYLWDNNQSIRWDNLDVDIHISNFFEEESVNYDNEVNHLLSKFPWLDVKVFAEYIGMHWTKLARFRYGVWTPTPETLDKIRNGIIALGKKMVAAAF